MLPSVNQGPDPGAGLERALLHSLSALLNQVQWLGEVRVRVSQRPPPDGADGFVDLGLVGERTVQLRVHIKKELRPGAFAVWAVGRRLAGNEAAFPILGMPLVSPRLGDLCEKAGWSWYDLAGNCRIDVPGVLHVERRGMAPVWRPPRSRANLGTAAAGRVLRVLLSPAHAANVWRQRHLREATSWQIDKDKPVSLGLVNKVVGHLRDEGYVTGGRAKGYRVRDPMGLLAAWSDAYRFDRHERRSYFTLLRGEELHRRLHRVGIGAGGMAVYAAFSAAERQAAYVRQPKTWLYVSGEYLDSLVQHAQAKEVDSGENLVVLIPDDSGVFVSFDVDSRVGEEGLGCTDPVQTYIDLAHCGGRGEEAARALLEQRILPAWKSRAGE